VIVAGVQTSELLHTGYSQQGEKEFTEGSELVIIDEFWL
jgi:hypothetical protein